MNHRKLGIPKERGRGYCIGFVFNQYIRMLISNYELYEDVAIRNAEIDVSKRVLFFKFQNVFPQTNIDPTQLQKLPTVLIATSRVNMDDSISVHTNVATINIEVDVDYLGRLFDSVDSFPILQNLLKNTQALLFEQIIFPSLQEIINKILSDTVDETFELFYYRVKAEELICKLLMELKKRTEKQFYPLNTNDIQTIYKVKEQMLQHLDTPPVIHELSTLANMSPTKLKCLFKQIFGDSIFSYYQSFRMQEAARLLKAGNLSVSEVGYQLGFTNLSHFSRVFAQHIGMKPKKYSSMTFEVDK